MHQHLSTGAAAMDPASLPVVHLQIEGTQAMFKRGTAPSSTGERYELAIQG